jgi:hypothetical protein
MLLALIGFIGVLLGAVLNATWTYALARRSEHRDLRTAARLLLPELLENREQLKKALETGSWSYVEFSTDRWGRHQVEFMRALDGEWIDLTKTYKAFDLLVIDRRIREEEDRNDSILDDGDDFDYCELTLEAADRATASLRKVAGLRPDEALRIQEVFCV